MSQQNTLSVTYKSPDSEPFTLETAISAPPSASVADKTQYLTSLRQAVSAAQDHINKELTTRMEEDKAREAAGKPGAAGLAVDEDKEEENYGEEVQGEDD